MLILESSFMNTSFTLVLCFWFLYLAHPLTLFLLPFLISLYFSLPLLFLSSLFLLTSSSSHSRIYIIHFFLLFLLLSLPNDYYLLLFLDLLSSLTVMIIYLESPSPSLIWAYFLYQALVSILSWIYYSLFGLSIFLLYMKAGLLLGLFYLPIFYSSLSSLSLPSS